MNRTCNNGESLVLFVSVYNENHTYESSVSGKNPREEFSFYRVGYYEKQGEHADYAFGAKQKLKQIQAL